MEHARLGSSGLQVSRICLGCVGFGDAGRRFHEWVLDEENSRPIISKVLDLGINVFDTALGDPNWRRTKLDLCHS